MKRGTYTLHGGNIIGGKPVVATVVLMCFLLLAWHPAWADQPKDQEKGRSPVQMQVELGWQGKIVPHRYAPAVIEIKNSGADDLSGVVEAINYYSYVPPSPPGQTKKPAPKYYPSNSYGEKISLPAGGKKRIILWFPINGTGDKVTFVFRSGNSEMARVTEKIPGAAIAGPNTGGVGVLGEIPPALERVRLVMPDGVPRVPTVLELSNELFPRRGQELDAFSTILITAARANTLDLEQRQALTQWVGGGGQLVISGGLAVDEAKSILTKDDVPVTAGQFTERSNWQSAAQWLGAPAAESGSATVANLSGPGAQWGPTDAPLGLKLGLNHGFVLVLTFDPAKVPWRGGSMGESLWQKILTPEDPNKWGYDPYQNSNKLGQFIYHVNNLPADAFPGWRPVGLYLLVFIIIAAPCVYFVLRRLQRPEYTWFAVPLLALLFSASIYLYMMSTGSNVVMNVVQVVDSQSGSGQSQYTAVGYFVPTKSVYEAVLKDPNQSVYVESMGGRPMELMKESDDPPYSVIKGTDLTVCFRSDTQWNMRTIGFTNQQKLDPKNSLNATVAIHGNKIMYKAQNNTDMDLDHVTLFMGYNHKMLGSLKAGAGGETEMQVTIPKHNDPDYYRYPSASQVFAYPQGLPAPPKPGVNAPPPPGRRLNVDERRCSSLMDSWMSDIIHGGEIPTGWPMVALAWSNNNRGDLGLKSLSKNPHYLTMFVVKPKLEIAPGSFTIPAGLIKPETTRFGGQGYRGYNNLIGLEGGSMMFEFKPDLPPDIRIQNITVNFDYFAAQGGSKYDMGSPAAKSSAVPDGVLMVFHPGQNNWQPLVGSSPFKLPADWVTPDGEVKIQVRGTDPNQGNGFYFQPPTLAYGGEKS